MLLHRMLLFAHLNRCLEVQSTHFQSYLDISWVELAVKHAQQQKKKYLFSKPKDMLWVLKRNIPMRWFFDHPKHMLKNEE